MEHTKARKGDLVFIEHTTSHVSIDHGRTVVLEAKFGLVESATRDGLVKVARDGYGMTYDGAGSTRRNVTRATILVVPSDKLTATPAEVMAALGTEPWPHSPEHTRARTFASRQDAIDALAPYRNDLVEVA